MYEMYGDPSPRNRPCVGSCYYEKLQGLQSKTKADQIPNETVQVNNMIKSYILKGRFLSEISMRLKKMCQITILSKKFKYSRVPKKTGGNLILFW